MHYFLCITAFLTQYLPNCDILYRMCFYFNQLTILSYMAWIFFFSLLLCIPLIIKRKQHLYLLYPETLTKSLHKVDLNSKQVLINLNHFFTSISRISIEHSLIKSWIKSTMTIACNISTFLPKKISFFRYSTKPESWSKT